MILKRSMSRNRIAKPVSLWRALDGGVHALREQQTVGKTGQRVAVGQLFNALFCAACCSVRSRMKPMLCTSRPSSSRKATQDSCTAQ